MARPSQVEPSGDWSTWLILAGRGWGKTRTGAEWVAGKARNGIYGRFALVAETAADARDVMVEGESGLLNIGPHDQRPRYEPSKRRVVWPNGAIATTYSAEEPDQLRGPQHDAFWADEAAKWRYEDSWDQLQFGLRLGVSPRGVVTTTPRPTKLIRTLVKDPTTRVTSGNTLENQLNLAANFIHVMKTKYEGTRLGRQELAAEILDDLVGALWSRSMFDQDRIRRLDDIPPLIRVVVAIDPPATSGETANEAGITVTGKDAHGHGYLLEDLSRVASPMEWAMIAVEAYKRWKADRIVAEVNNGGEMVENTLRMVDESVSYKAVHASRGKLIRAEPIAAMYEQHRIHHLGMFSQLEDQLCAFAPGQPFDGSPDRMDSMVWGFTDLLIDPKQQKKWALG